MCVVGRGGPTVCNFPSIKCIQELSDNITFIQGAIHQQLDPTTLSQLVHVAPERRLFVQIKLFISINKLDIKTTFLASHKSRRFKVMLILNAFHLLIRGNQRSLSFELFITFFYNAILIMHGEIVTIHCRTPFASQS